VSLSDSVQDRGTAAAIDARTRDAPNAMDRRGGGLRGLTTRFPDAAVVAVLIILTFAETWLATRSRFVAGRWEDDGIYMATAKSLAEGKGYKHVEFPGEPYQTKYPILYPLVLSLVWRTFPSFPQNVVVMQVLNGFFAAGAAAVGYRLVRRIWGLSPLLAGAGIVLAVSTLDWLELIRLTMSEHLYTLLSLAALMLAVDPAPGSPDAVSRRRLLTRSILSALFASAAYLTRSIGIVLIVALFIHWLLRRRWLSALCLMLLAAAAIAGWQSWRLIASEHNAAISQAACFAYDLDYTVWLPRDWDFALRVMLYNAAAMCFWVLYYLGQPSQAWVQTTLVAGLPDVALLYALIGLAVCLFVIGLVSAWRFKHAVIHIYLLVYLGMVCAWPFDPERFFLPLMPILAPLALLGFRRVCAAGQRLVQRLFMPLPDEASTAPPQPPAPAVPVHLRLGRTGAILTIILLLNYLGVTMTRLNSPYEKDAEQDRAAAVEMLKVNTPPVAIIAAANTAYYYLAAGRKTVPFYPVDEYPALYYAPDRAVLFFGQGLSAGHLAATRRLLERRYLDYGRITGMTHVLVPGDDGVYGVFLQYRSTESAHFPLVAAKDKCRLYRFRP